MFDGTSYGDATFSLFYGNSRVVPNYLNELIVEAGTGEVTVGTGAALVFGYAYENTAAVSATLDAIAANPRFDYIVLELDTATQTVRVVVVKGAEAAAPSLPALASDQFPLAFVYVPAGFGAATAVNVYDIHDVRYFQATALDMQSNQLKNSEFLAFADTTKSPARWDLDSTPTLTRDTRLSDHARGYACGIASAGAGRGISQKVRVRELEDFTLKVPVDFTSGPAWIELYDETNAASIVIRSIQVDTTEIIRFTTPADCVLLDVRIYGDNGADFSIGQCILTHGKTAPSYRQEHEVIFLRTALTDASWTATVKAAGTHAIDLDADFSGIIPTGCRGVIAVIGGEDSGASGGECGIYATASDDTAPLAGVSLSGVDNNTYRENQIWVPLYDNQFGVWVIVTTAFTASLRIVGIIT